MKDYLVPFTGVFEIERRLREIDDNYRLYYNKKLSRFEVHNLSNRGGDTLSVVCPYAEVDSRLIRIVRQTRVERGAELVKEMEETNAKLLKEKEDKEKELAKFKAKARLEELKSRLVK